MIFKTHRYKPLLAPGIALTLIYLLPGIPFPGSLFLADKSLPFCLQSSFLDLLFPVCGVAGSGCGTRRRKTYKQYRHLENTIGAAVYFYLFKMARVPGKIGFAVGLMLIMNIF